MFKCICGIGPLALVLVACAPVPDPAAAPAPAVIEEPAMAETPLMTWPDLLAIERPIGAEAIRWGAGETDIADLWLPAGAGPHPVAVMVHGGCWQKSIADRTLMDWMAHGLAQRGWAVWNIEYRGISAASVGPKIGATQVRSSPGDQPFRWL